MNLDPSLLLFLREIHYLSQQPYNVPMPPAARQLLRNTDPTPLNVMATRLETVACKYNTIMKMISDYERPLFERKLARIDQVFKPIAFTRNVFDALELVLCTCRAMPVVVVSMYCFCKQYFLLQ